MNLHRTIAVLTVIVAATGCSGDDTTTDTSTEPSSTVRSTSTSATAAVPPTSSSTSSTTVATPITSSPTTATTTAPPGSSQPAESEDWAAVIQNLVDVRDELYATSDPSRAGEVCAADAFCYQQLVAQLSDAQSKGWRVVDQGPLTIRSATLENSDITNGIEFAVVRTEITLSDDHGRVVDAEGNTVYELVPDDPNAPREGIERWTLVRTPGGWRLFDQETVS